MVHRVTTYRHHRVIIIKFDVSRWLSRVTLWKTNIVNGMKRREESAPFNGFIGAYHNLI